MFEKLKFYVLLLLRLFMKAELRLELNIEFVRIQNTFIFMLSSEIETRMTNSP